MSLASLQVRTAVSGLMTVAGTQTLTDDSAEVANPQVVKAAQPGNLAVRTSATAGTLTMDSAGHGIITGQRFDLFWAGGAAYGLAAGTVAGTSVPFTSAAGDALPAALTDVVAGIAKESAFDLVGNDMTALVAGGQGSARAYVVVESVAPADLLAILLTASGPPYVWNGIGTNPLAGTTPVKIWMSHDSTDGAKSSLQAVALRH